MRTIYFQFIGISIGLLFTLFLNAQSVGINDDGSQPNAAAILDIKSSNKGVLIPRTDTSTINTLGTPVTGLIIYQASDDVFYYFDGTRWLKLMTGEKVFDRVENLVRQYSNFETDDLIFGRNALPESGENITDKFLLFSKSKGAFRVGQLEGSQNWKPSYIGTGSVAFGYNTRASGDYSKAFGFTDQATGYNSFSWGLFTEASGWNATVFGEDAVAVGGNSFCWGESNQANGWNSTAWGRSTVAPSYSESVLGSFNTLYTPNSTSSWNDNDRLFVIGNGILSARSNALTILKNGNTTIKGELTLTDGSNPFTFPKTDGNADEVLITDGSGSLSWMSGNNLGLFERSGTLIRQKGNFDTDDFIWGRESLPVNSVNITDDLFFFDQSESTFRLGHLFNSDAWSPENSGYGSYAVGFNPKAAGDFSVAYGRYTTAPSYLETVFGNWNTSYSPVSSVSWNENDRLFVIGNGNSFTPSNAFTILKNGNTTIKGELTLSDGNAPYTLPNSDGVANQVLSTNGLGSLSWTEKNEFEIFERNGNLIRQKSNVDTDDFIIGRTSLPGNGEKITDYLFFFDQSKGAFRLGVLEGSDNWSEENLGTGSMAWGYNSLAQGDYSFAWGNNSNGLGSHSTSWGDNATAEGNYSTAWGDNATAEGDYSTAWGYESHAKGKTSTSWGRYSNAESYLETTIGQYNKDYSPLSTTTWNLNDRLFVIGNGSSNQDRKNALTILKNGNVGIGTSNPENYLHVSGDASLKGVGHFVNTRSGHGYGIYAQANETDHLGWGGYFKGGWMGVRGEVESNSLDENNVYVGIYGKVEGGTGVNYGVFGDANGENINIGVYGTTGNDGDSNLAGFFGGKVKIDGDLEVTGDVSKSGGSFKIDHPLDPKNKFLYHSFVESPDMKNLYDGVKILDKHGKATITLPDWFESINMDFRYQITCIGGWAPVFIEQEISDGKFKIAGGKPGMKISWQVTGIRNDPYTRANRIQVEVEKLSDERGKYVHPEIYGVPKEKGINYKHKIVK